MRHFIHCIALFLLLLSPPVQADPEKLSQALDAIMPDTGFSFYVIDADREYAAVAGLATPDGQKVTADHMFRIASTTKTYTAAAVLRLVEQGMLDLGASVGSLVSPKYAEILKGDGYDIDSMTLKQVLSHTAGLYDHAQSDNYIATIFENPDHVWTREEQVRAGAEWGDPLGAPSEKFFYSDTGYLLLGDIIERAAGKPLPVAVRELLGFDKHNLTDTFWERGDSKAVPDERRVHQFLAGRDTHSWDPSLDLYGGGGLVATPRDMARFYALLMADSIFDKPETLKLMLSPDGLPENSPYRLGVFEKTYDDVHVYEHGGFWGTLALHEPASGITIAAAALRQEDYPKLAEAMAAFLRSKRN